MRVELSIKRDGGRGYVVIRDGGSYRQHAHVSSKNGARQLIYLIHKGLLPRSHYLQESCRRLLTPQEYGSLRVYKCQYKNDRRRL